MKYLTLRFPIRYVNHFTWLIQFAEYLPEIKVNNPASNIIPIDVFLEKKNIDDEKIFEYGIWLFFSRFIRCRKSPGILFFLDYIDTIYRF